MCSRLLKAHLTIAELAETANMNARHFSRTFVRETKVTPAEFVERARAAAVRVVLASSQLPLKTVAYECGVRSPHHMRNWVNRGLLAGRLQGLIRVHHDGGARPYQLIQKPLSIHKLFREIKTWRGWRVAFKTQDCR